MNAAKKCVRESCPSTKYELKGGKCILKKCPTGFSKVNDECVRDCEKHFKNIDGACRRVSCPENYKFNKETRRCTIIKCPEGFKKSKSGACNKVTCEANHIYINEKCV